MFSIHADSRSVERYRELLVSDWRRTFPEQVVDLLWQVVSSSGVGRGERPLVRLLDPTDGDDFPAEYFERLVGIITDGSRFVRMAGLPALPADYRAPGRMTKGPRLAGRLAGYLTLPAHADIGGDVEFMADLQSLAFHAAIRFVLPDLRDRHPAEHAILLHSTALYAVGYSTYDPAHYAYMLSMIYDYLNDEDRRIGSLQDSFRFTSPQDHSYLTKAQELWAELLDRGRFAEAERFLLSLHAGSLPDQREEVREMIVEAMRYIVKNEKRNAIA